MASSGRPTTVDTTTNTLFFGTGSATPLYFPSIRPGSNPRADSLIAVDLATGRMKWWQQQMAHNEWSYDTAQPPLVYNAKVGGSKQRIVSVGTMEGVWFAYNAANGRPIYQRIKVIDRTEHPTLKAGKPVAVFPSSIGGINYSPASFDPKTNYIFNGAAETASLETQAQLTPTQKKRKFTLGDVFLGLANGNFGSVLPGWHDHGSISAIDVNSGKRVWKFTTPEPERGGITTTDSGLGFAGGGDGVLRAFDLGPARCSGRSRPGTRLRAARRSSRSAARSTWRSRSAARRRLPVAGTRPSFRSSRSAARRQQSPPPPLPRALQSISHPTLRGSVARPAAAAAQGFGSIPTQGGLVVRLWQANSSNVARVGGRVLLNGSPVAGAGVSLDGYTMPQATAKDGSFKTDVDITIPLRRVVHVVGVAHATVHGRALSAGQRSCASGGVGRLRRRLRHPGPAREGREGRKRRRQWSPPRRESSGTADGATTDLPAHRHDHGQEREAGARRCGDHTYAGPRLLDALVAPRMRAATTRRSSLRRTRPPPIQSSSPSGSRRAASRTAATSVRTRRSSGCGARC